MVRQRRVKGIRTGILARMTRPPTRPTNSLLVRSHTNHRITGRASAVIQRFILPAGRCQSNNVTRCSGRLASATVTARKSNTSSPRHPDGRGYPGKSSRQTQRNCRGVFEMPRRPSS
ncbi:Uncharacterised protein [Mycobacteroides abscessus subsp. abscessus]|nr:Uncharacterised protein [Mycobacteroides abscessus subsp. abscessus]